MVCAPSSASLKLGHRVEPLSLVPTPLAHQVLSPCVHAGGIFHQVNVEGRMSQPLSSPKCTRKRHPQEPRRCCCRGVVRSSSLNVYQAADLHRFIEVWRLTPNFV